MNYFEIKKVRKTDENKPYSIELVDSEYNNMKIGIKWDGCIDIFKYSNGYTTEDENIPEDNVDYMHICEVKEFIERLQEVVRIAEENFSEEDFEYNWK